MLVSDGMSLGFARRVNGQKRGQIINGKLAESYRRHNGVAGYCDECGWEMAYNPVRQILRQCVNNDMNCDRDTLRTIKRILFR